ncbi:hypothetical protein BJ170DRAFT_734020 [Xylariales sp. AK1849]|nr:hypothetical protein BJ170DRAFT_734020 [Xylariales sp. AK1849]
MMDTGGIELQPRLNDQDDATPTGHYGLYGGLHDGDAPAGSNAESGSPRRYMWIDSTTSADILGDSPTYVGFPIWAKCSVPAVAGVKIIGLPLLTLGTWMTFATTRASLRTRWKDSMEWCENHDAQREMVENGTMTTLSVFALYAIRSFIHASYRHRPLRRTSLQVSLKDSFHKSRPLRWVDLIAIHLQFTDKKHVRAWSKKYDEEAVLESNDWGPVAVTSPTAHGSDENNTCISSQGGSDDECSDRRSSTSDLDEMSQMPPATGVKSSIVLAYPALNETWPFARPDGDLDAHWVDFNEAATTHLPQLKHKRRYPQLYFIRRTKGNYVARVRMDENKTTEALKTGIR